MLRTDRRDGELIVDYELACAVVVTPDELGDAWDEGTVKLLLVTHLNGELFDRQDSSIFGAIDQQVVRA